MCPHVIVRCLLDAYPIGQLANKLKRVVPYLVLIYITSAITMFMTHQYKITSVIKFDGFYHALSRTILIPLEHLKVERSRCCQICQTSYVKRGAERTNNTTTQRYVTASINVGSINYEHAWCTAKMEGIVSVIVTAVDTVSLSVL